jgi:hypothetical protein
VHAGVDAIGARCATKRNDHPELRRAICRAKVSGARLIAAEFDRLSCNVSFLLNLRDSGVQFIAADLPIPWPTKRRFVVRSAKATGLTVQRRVWRLPTTPISSLLGKHVRLCELEHTCCRCVLLR